MGPADAQASPTGIKAPCGAGPVGCTERVARQCAVKMADRDRWIGWRPEQHYSRLHPLVGNTRFAMLTETQSKKCQGADGRSKMGLTAFPWITRNRGLPESKKRCCRQSRRMPSDPETSHPCNDRQYRGGNTSSACHRLAIHLFPLPVSSHHRRNHLPN